MMRNGHTRTIEPLTYRVPEAAVALNVSRSTTYELIAAGVIPSIKIGSSIRVPVEALRQYIDRQLVESREAGR